MNAPTKDGDYILVDSDTIGVALARLVRLRKTPREGGTTNCHSCGKEIPQSALCAKCWHKQFMKSRETNKTK